MEEEDEFSLSKSDDELLANLLDNDDKESKDRNDEDSADEILAALMQKENDSSPQKKTKILKRPKETINEPESDDDEQTDGDTADQIAALEAQLALLKKKSKSPKVKKEKNIKPTTDVSGNSIESGSDLCSHKKNPKFCFFCNKTNSQSAHEKDKESDVDKNKGADMKIKDSLKTKKETTQNKEVFRTSSYTLPEDRPIKGMTSSKFYEQKEKTTRVAHDAKSPTITKAKPLSEPKVSKPVVKPKDSNGSQKNNLCFGGITLSHPKLSSAVIEQRLQDKRVVKCSKIKTTMRNDDIEGDWVTVGAVVQKTSSKKANNGKNFSVWKLSDLGVGTENETVGFFLFGDVYKEHWKISVGCVVALLNPNIMKSEKDQGVSISLDNPKKLMELGVAKDFDTCKGIRKSDGNQCSMFINKQYGEFCEYHVQRAFKKAKAGRAELQSGINGPDRTGSNKLMNAVKKEISNGVYHYGGQTLSLSKKESKVKLKPTNTPPVKGGLESIMGSDLKKQAAANFKRIKQERDLRLEGGSKELSELLGTPTFGSRNLVQHLHGAKEKEESVKEPKKFTSTVKGFLRENKTELAPKREAETSKKRKFSDINFFEGGVKTNGQPTPKLAPTNKKRIPMLGRGLKGDTIEFIDNDDDDHMNYNKYIGEDVSTSNPTMKTILQNSMQVEHLPRKQTLPNSRAKLKALALIQKSGLLEAEDPNAIMKKKKKKMDSLKRIEEKVDESNKESEATPAEKPTKKGILSGVLGHLDLNSKEGKKLLEKKSRNVGAIEQAENEREEKYFNGLVKKEQMEEKMLNTYEITVAVVACRVCSYMAEGRSKFCQQQKHTVSKLPKVVKRFFKCKSCSNRTSTYNKQIPQKACSKCGENNFEKVAMMQERKSPKLSSETLEVRGREQKFINS